MDSLAEQMKIVFDDEELAAFFDAFEPLAPIGDAHDDAEPLDPIQP